MCTIHPHAPVVLLHTTTKYFKNDVPEYVDEESECAIGVELDEANLYCPIAGDSHKVGFKVVDDGWA